MRNLDTDEQLGMLVEGVTVKMGADDAYLAENVQTIQYSAAEAHFENVGEILDFEGRTAEITPESLING